MRRPDNWTAAWSPGHPAAVEKLLMANAGLLPIFHKTECVSAVQTDAQCHFQIEFMCVHVRWVGCARTAFAIVCLQVSVPFVLLSMYGSILLQQMFFPMCVLAESDQHQPAQ